MRRTANLVPAILRIGGIILTIMPLASATGHAQCPPGYLGSTVILTPADIPSLPCNVTVVYCYPDPMPVPPNPYITPQEQIIIDSWTFACGAGGITMTASLLNEISTKVLASSPTVITACSNTTIPTCSEWCQQHPDCFCPTAFAAWTVTDGGCVKNMTWAGTQTRIEPCYGVDRCASVYQICCDDNGSPQVKWLASDNGTLYCLNGGPECYQVCVDAQAGASCCDQYGNPVSHCPNGRCPDSYTGSCN